MISREGYPAETHLVETEDCYYLTMHRIPHGRDDPKNGTGGRPAVYLQHGLLCSSADWIMGSADNSLGFLLADAGYDVDLDVDVALVDFEWDVDAEGAAVVDFEWDVDAATSA